MQGREFFVMLAGTMPLIIDKDNYLLSVFLIKKKGICLILTEKQN